MATQFHEDFKREGEEPKATERSFGRVFAVVFAVIGLLPLLAGHPVRWWALAVAVLFLALAYAAPRVLAPLNRIWMAVGRILNRIVSPVMMTLLFIVAVVPTGLWLRARGKDPLRLKRDPAAQSYWLARDPPGPGAESFKNQF